MVKRRTIYLLSERLFSRKFGRRRGWEEEGVTRIDVTAH